MIPVIVLLIILTIASISDIKTMTVPLDLWLIPIVAKALYLMYAGQKQHVLFQNTMEELFICLGIAIVTFLVFVIMSFLSNLGGADALLFTSIAFVLEYYVIYCALFSFLFVLPYTGYLFWKKEKKEYPFVPYMLAGTCFCILLMKTGVI